mgnify:CR=1 FL=1
MSLESFLQTYERELYLYFLSDQNKDLIDKENKYNFSAETKEENIYKFYNEKKLQNHLGDPLYSLLLVNLYSRFGEIYKKYMNPQTKKKIANNVNVLINKHKLS